MKWWYFYKMWAKPTQKQLDNLPKLGAQDGEHTKDTIVHGHFFVGGCDWYVTEFDGKDTFFGFAILMPGSGMSEWGYVSFNELKSLKVQGFAEVDWDKHWTVRKVSEVDKIVQEGGSW